MRPTRIHHLNFVVRDLDAAILEYETKLGLEPFTIVDHESRGSRIATSQIGETAFVLVCPYDETSVPGRYLRQHGEGFFLLSLGVEDLEDAIREFSGASDARDGIRNWRVADIGTFFGSEIQLTNDPVVRDA